MSDHHHHNHVESRTIGNEGMARGGGSDRTTTTSSSLDQEERRPHVVEERREDGRVSPSVRQHHHHQIYQEEVNETSQSSGSSSSSLGGQEVSSQQSSSTRSSTTSTTSSVMMTPLNPNFSLLEDVDAISLLKQIFPEESPQALRQLHHDHLLSQQRKTKLQDSSTGPTSLPLPFSSSVSSSSQECILPTSNLGRRIWQTLRRNNHNDNNNYNNSSSNHDDSLQENTTTTMSEWKPFELDDNFLRLPTSVAVRRLSTATGGSRTTSRDSGGVRYHFIADLHDQVVQEYVMIQQSRNSSMEEPTLIDNPDIHNPTKTTTIIFSQQRKQQQQQQQRQEEEEVDLFTVVIHRHDQIGIGLTLTVKEEQSSKTRKTGKWMVQIHSLLSHPENPCLMTPIRPMDVLLGINGDIFYAPTITTVVKTIRNSPDPLVLHLLRFSTVGRQQQERLPNHTTATPHVERDHSLLDDAAFNPDEVEYIHDQEVQTTIDDQSVVTTSTMTTTTSSSWGKTTSHRTIVPKRYPRGTKTVIHKIHPLARALCRKGLIRGLADEERVTKRLYEFHHRAQQWEEYQSLLIDTRTGTLVPRDATPDDHSHMANMNMRSPPSSPPLNHMDVTGGPVGVSSPLHVYPGQISRHVSTLPLYYIRKALCARIVNTFEEQIGNDSRMAFTIWVYDVETTQEWYAPIRFTQDFEDLYHACRTLVGPIDMDFPIQSKTWFRRKRKHTFEDTIRFEHFLRQLSAWIYTCERLSPAVAEMAIHVQSFLGVESAMAEAPLQISIPSRRQELKMALQRYTHRVTLLTVMTSLTSDFCEATRQRSPELPEIDTLKMHSMLQTRARSDLGQIQNFLDSLVDLILEGCGDDLKAISRHEYYAEEEDMMDLHTEEDIWGRFVREAVREQVEIEVYVPLRSVVSRLLVHGWRHEDFQVQFKLKELRKRQPSRENIPWQIVSKILREGVGMSTLPCVKLRAIVTAAKELARHYESADDFLPLFIYCVVQADLERPCALCVLLQTLCDKWNRMGEIGYFLASFEAAIAHITDLDLSEPEEDVDDRYLSFSSEPLTEVSLSDD